MLSKERNVGAVWFKLHTESGGHPLSVVGKIGRVQFCCHGESAETTGHFSPPESLLHN